MDVTTSLFRLVMNERLTICVSSHAPPALPCVKTNIWDMGIFIFGGSIRHLSCAVALSLEKRPVLGAPFGPNKAAGERLQVINSSP